MAVGAGKFLACEEFLSPLLAGLEVCLKGPHQWDVMKSYCLQIIECYGNQSLYIDADMGHRLKCATKYLALAARIDNMKFDVERNVLKVVETSSLVGAPCQEDLAVLLAAVTSSSVYGGNKDSVLSKVEDSTGTAAVSAKGKAKKGEATPAVHHVGNVPAARDALLMLSSLSRELDPFWCDGNEYFVLFDLVKRSTANFDSFKSKYFLSSLPDAEGELVVTEGSITSLWVPSAVSQSNESNRTCMFPGATGYILLGGFKENEEDGFTSSEPFLTKVEVNRLDLSNMELKFRRIGEKIESLSRVKAENHHEISMAILEDMASTLKDFFFFVRGGPSSKKDVELVVITPVHQVAVGKYFATVEVAGRKVSDIELSSDAMAEFASVVAQNKACSNLESQKSVAMYFWAALKK